MEKIERKEKVMGAKVRELSREELRKMQLLQLDILKEFDRICRKHGLKYTLCGGSMLGAVRHKGFIPWDDDVDVTLLRKDYEKFCEICKTELDSEKYFLQTMDTDPEYRLIYGKILLNGTAFVRAGQEHLKSRNGIFIDIFPRDGKSDCFPIRYIQKKLAYLMRKTLYSPVGAKKTPHKFNRFIFRMLSKLPRSFPYKLNKLIDALNFKKETTYVSCFGLMADKEKKKLELGKEGYKAYVEKIMAMPEEEREERRIRNIGLKRVFFEEVMDMQFEDMQAMVTTYYDDWLRINYDDYMQLPPEEKRVMHQTISHIDFGKY